MPGNVPIEAAGLERFRPTRKIKKKPEGFSPGRNTDTDLWRAIRRQYGQLYNSAHYLRVCQLGRLRFGLDAEQTVLMKNFSVAWRRYIKQARTIHEYDWCCHLIEILREEVDAARPLPHNDPDLMRRTSYFQLDLANWFVPSKNRRDKIRQRLLLLRAAQKCRISPLNLLIDHNLVDVSVLMLHASIPRPQR